MLVVGRHDAVEHRFRIPVDHLQRRPQLVTQLLGQLDPALLCRVERIQRLDELSSRPLPPDLLAHEPGQHFEERLLVGGEGARLEVVEAERPVERAVGKSDLPRAEGEEVPLDS